MKLATTLLLIFAASVAGFTNSPAGRSASTSALFETKVSSGLEEYPSLRYDVASTQFANTHLSSKFHFLRLTSKSLERD